MANINYLKMKKGFIKTHYGNIYYKHNTSLGSNKYKLLLIHGLGGTVNSFKNLINVLPSNIEIYAIDLLGHGRSDKPNLNYNINIQSRVLNDFIKKTKFNNFYIFGHSYGAHVAMKYALDYGTQKINAFIIEDSPILSKNIINLHRDKKLIKKIMQIALKSKTSKKSIILKILNNITNEGFTNLKHIDKPLLILWGEKDDITKIDFAYKLNKNLNFNNIKIIKNAKHTPHHSNAQELKNILIEFMEYK